MPIGNHRNSLWRKFIWRKFKRVESLQAKITLFVVISTGLFALICGGWRERIGGFAILLSLGFGYLLMNVWNGYGLWPFIIFDLICLGLFISLCWKSPHPWPIWASAAQGLNLMCSLISPAATRMWEPVWWSLTTALLITGYGIVLAVFIGTLAAFHRRNRVS